jgi:hypothetical protein
LIGCKGAARMLLCDRVDDVHEVAATESSSKISLFQQTTLRACVVSLWRVEPGNGGEYTAFQTGMEWLNPSLPPQSPTRIDRTQEVAGSSPASSIPSISRGHANNQSVRYEPRLYLTAYRLQSTTAARLSIACLRLPSKLGPVAFMRAEGSLRSGE